MRQIAIRGGCLGALMLLGTQTAYAVTYLEQIDRLAAINAALLDYRPVAAPGPRARGAVEVGVELDPVPSINNQLGAKHEPVKAPPVGGKLRVDWSPKQVSGLRVGMYWVPPVTVMHITANLSGVEAEYGWKRYGLGHEIVYSFRLFERQGLVTGPFSGPGVKDQFRVRGAGADLRMGMVDGNWTWYGGLGYGENHTQFHMAADGALIDGQRNYRYGFVGAGWVSGRWSLDAEQQQTESYLRNILFRVNYAY